MEYMVPWDPSPERIRIIQDNAFARLDTLREPFAEVEQRLAELNSQLPARLTPWPRSWSWTR